MKKYKLLILTFLVNVIIQIKFFIDNQFKLVFLMLMRMVKPMEIKLFLLYQAILELSERIIAIY